MSTLPEFYDQVATGYDLNPRLRVFLDEYRRHRGTLGRDLDVLDVGCGARAVLQQHVERGDRYFGTDIKTAPEVDVERYARVDLNEDSLADAFETRTFDVVFCGEVMEHVFSPDRLLRELRSVLHEQSLLIVSTPNLAYWVNRILLLGGISPLFVENSAEVKLGRRTRFLGQGNETQGHIRLFTHRAALELLERERLDVVGVRSVPVWNLPIDKLVCRFSPKLSPVNIYLTRLPAA
jgi:2-polyprenyl-3-methyl-5-hydroxy-6-metoxy-1,4-benzoquinol methylase